MTASLFSDYKASNEWIGLNHTLCADLNTHQKNSTPKLFKKYLEAVSENLYTDDKVTSSGGPVKKVDWDTDF